MTTRLYLTTKINAQVELCFDLSRSVEVHCSSMGPANEQAVAGKTSGLLNEKEWVTWRGRHLGVTIRHTSTISVMNRPQYFEDKMLRGVFKSMVHKHYFAAHDTTCLMIDDFCYSLPLRLTGTLLDRKVVKPYLRRLLTMRNRHIKNLAERGHKAGK